MLLLTEIDKKKLNSYCDTIAPLNDYSVQLLLYTLVKNDIFSPCVEWDNINQLLTNKKISYIYEKLIQAIISILSKMHLVDLSQGKIRFTALLTQYSHKISEIYLQGKKENLIQIEPTLIPLINFIEKCIVNYPDILTKNLHSFQILFPNGSLQQIEEVYVNDVIASYYNQLLAKLILQKIENKLKTLKKITVLEIGAGTGATSRYVFSAIKHLKDSIIYYYSDISMTFINHGIEKFKMENPFVIFKRFNIEKIDIDNNDLDINGFDIIICSNVIHATKNIRNVLSSLKSLLKEQGSLYLNELISNPTYITLTFGLSYGWWHYEDTESRIPCSPLLKLEKWLELLRESGFSDITTHGSEDILTPDVKQAIIEAS